MSSANRHVFRQPPLTAVSSANRLVFRCCFSFRPALYLPVSRNGVGWNLVTASAEKYSMSHLKLWLEAQSSRHTYELPRGRIIVARDIPNKWPDLSHLVEWLLACCEDIHETVASQTPPPPPLGLATVLSKITVLCFASLARMPCTKMKNHDKLKIKFI